MGFNTAISICNDNLGDYERNPERFVKIIYDGINDGNKLWGITVHPSEHADATQLIAVGGNFSTRVHTTCYVSSHHTKEGQIDILRSWADALGYRISKKPTEKK